MRVNLILLWLFCVTVVNSDDLPCRVRDVGIAGRSIVCVCDANYCDTITREEPRPGTYVVYTSSDAGLRFAKTYGVIQQAGNETAEQDDVEFPEPTDADYEDTGKFSEEQVLRSRLRIYTSRRLQRIEGFGGSVTDAASINWRKLSDAAQTRLINTYFGSEGIEYNLIRVPIGGCDFSTHPYTYNEMPWNDAALTNYTLAEEDLFYKLPMIRRSQRVATDEIKITASTWSPPIWMKTNEMITGFGQLKPEFYQSYADYHVRFLEEYEKADVNIWAITTTNEPINGIIPLVNFNSLGWTPRQLMEYEDPKSIDYIDGVAIHYYGNFVPARILTTLQRRYPDKILLSTEACEGAMPWDKLKVEIGSWRRARRYTTSIMQDLNNFVVGWIDWNLCLDPEGGPNWADNFVDAPILVYGDRDEFIKQPMYYAMGHFAKFIPRGSRRIQVSRRSIITVENVAFLKSSGNIVIVLQNRRSRVIDLRIRLNRLQFIDLRMEPRSIKTVEVNPN